MSFFLTGTLLSTDSISWVQHFLSLKGQVALAKYLSGVQAKEGKFYNPGDDSLELETLKCFKCSLNNVVSHSDGYLMMACLGQSH